MSTTTRNWVIGALGLLVGCALMMWLARMVDSHEDRPRPMYAQVLHMARLQTRALERGKDVVPVDLHAGDKVYVAGKRFLVKPGVRVRVKTDGDGYCVRGWNQYGDDTPWLCGDKSTTP